MLREIEFIESLGRDKYGEEFDLSHYIYIDPKHKDPVNIK